MAKFKKIILYISGPGVLLFEVIVVFIHLFSLVNTRPFIIGGLLVFFLVFLPLYSVEYFRQNFYKNWDKNVIQFRKKKTRTEWEGGNIHGKTPAKTARPGKLFDKE